MPAAINELTMSNALVFALFVAGSPVAEYAQDRRNDPGADTSAAAGWAVGVAVGAVVEAPFGAVGGFVGGLAGDELTTIHHYVTEQHVPFIPGRAIRGLSATLRREQAQLAARRLRNTAWHVTAARWSTMSPHFSTPSTRPLLPLVARLLALPSFGPPPIPP